MQAAVVPFSTGPSFRKIALARAALTAPWHQVKAGLKWLRSPIEYRCFKI